jgi:hypothetical protein
MQVAARIKTSAYGCVAMTFSLITASVFAGGADLTTGGFGMAFQKAPRNFVQSPRISLARLLSVASR